MATRKTLTFYLNGQRHDVDAEHGAMMLADYLRYEKGLTGTKIVCAEGDCGACSVLRYFPIPGKKEAAAYVPINSCISLLAQMDGASLVTVEALAEGRENPESHEAPHVATPLSAVQRAMVNCDASQCGYCTPGFAMALTGLVEKKLRRPESDLIGVQEAKNAMTGNLCRCTGYQALIDAACSVDLSLCEPLEKRFFTKEQKDALRKTSTQAVSAEGVEFSFYAPTKLKDAVAFLRKKKNARLLGAGTDLGVLHNKRKARLTQTLSLHLIPELYEIKESSGQRVSVGARVTLTELRSYLKDKIPEFARFLDIFASPQIKNVATLVGNVANASPIADTPPFLLAMRAKVQIVGSKGKRTVPLEKFFLDYRKTALKAGEFIAAIDFELPRPQEKLSLYKISERKDLDISTVNAAFRVTWKDAAKGITDQVFLAFGGVAATPLRIPAAEKILSGVTLTAARVEKAQYLAQEALNPLGDLRGSSSVRRLMIQNFFRKFFRDLVVGTETELRA